MFHATKLVCGRTPLVFQLCGMGVSAIDIFEGFHNPKMSRSHFETQVPYCRVTKQWCVVIRLSSPCLNSNS